MKLTDKNVCVCFLVYLPLISSLHSHRPLACTVSSVRVSVLTMLKWHWLLARSSCKHCLPRRWPCCELYQLAGLTGGGHNHPAYHYWCGFGDLSCVSVQCDSGCDSENTCWNPCKKSMCVPGPGDCCRSWIMWRSTSWLSFSFSSYFNESQNFLLSEF